ncbi:MAG: nucleotide exchange factor GrpE [Roseimicrobium sp.]
MSQTNVDAPSPEAPVAADAPPLQEPLAEATTLDPIAFHADVEKWKDMALRSAAELDNFRKRSAREMQDARAYANADLLRSLLPILDTFEMGLEAARVESEQSIVFQGLKMVQGMFGNFLRETGAAEIEAEGKQFDPNLHEALSTEPSDSVVEHGVIRVQRRGYRLKDRLLRPACVVVSSGPTRGEASA